MNDKIKVLRDDKVGKEFSFSGFLVRLAGTLVLVLATYNPSGKSFAHWVKADAAEGTLGPEHFVVGVLLVIGWVILLTATQQSMGTLGLALVAALLGGMVWLLIDLGVFQIDSSSELTWVILIALAVALAIGLSWSHVWRRLTGQFDTEDD
jgi:hypothetical protein